MEDRNESLTRFVSFKNIGITLPLCIAVLWIRIRSDPDPELFVSYPDLAKKKEQINYNFNCNFRPLLNSGSRDQPTKIIEFKFIHEDCNIN